MDGAELVTAVRTGESTKLDRLGSEKALVAATDAALERDEVLSSAAETERRAAETFRTWADDEEHDAARRAFAEVAEIKKPTCNGPVNDCARRETRTKGSTHSTSISGSTRERPSVPGQGSSAGRWRASARCFR